MTIIARGIFRPQLNIYDQAFLPVTIFKKMLQSQMFNWVLNKTMITSIISNPDFEHVNDIWLTCLEKKNNKTLWPLFMDGVKLPQG